MAELMVSNARGSGSQTVRAGTRQKETRGSLGATEKEMGGYRLETVDAVVGAQRYRSAVLRCDLKQGEIGSSMVLFL